MSEASIRSVLVKKLRTMQPTWVIFRHEDHYTTGIPDISVTGNGKTSWWETKLVEGREHPQEKELKLQRMIELDHHSYARYIVYRTGGIFKKDVSILTPVDFQQWPEHVARFWVASHDHETVARYIIQRHLA